MTDDRGTRALDRRGFLKLSAGGVASLALLSASTQLIGCAPQTARMASGYRWLNDADLAFIKVLIRGIAGPALATAGADTIVEEGARRVDLCAEALGAQAQKQLRQLFDLLQWSPFRRLAAGVSKPWSAASAADAQTMLARFRDSRLSLLNGAYRALVKLGSIAYWSQPATYGESRYPGPPAWAVAALNA